MSEFTELVDLAAARVGGEAVVANDEFFAPKENLLMPGRGVFIEDRYTERGKWMDGWESRRRREPGHDWCIVRLGVAGVVRGVDVDTNHFRGNYPESCSIDGCAVEGERGGDALASGETAWRELLARTRLEGDARNLFAVRDEGRVTHVRLNIHPDGGVARLRVYGEAAPEWGRIVRRGEEVDLAAVEHGGAPMGCSDRFFSHPMNLIMPGRAVNMGDGWETKRRRGAGHDWVVVRLGARGLVSRIEVDTNHFKGNYPDRCMIECCDERGGSATAERLAPGGTAEGGVEWRVLLGETRLRASWRHYFEKEIQGRGPSTHVRLNIYPDGGVSRLRVHGRPVVEGVEGVGA